MIWLVWAGQCEILAMRVLLAMRPRTRSSLPLGTQFRGGKVTRTRPSIRVKLSTRVPSQRGNANYIFENFFPDFL